LPDLRYENFPTVVVHVVDDAILPNSKAPRRPISKLAAISGTRVLGQGVYGLADLPVRAGYAFAGISLPSVRR
jgi:hypothetical protein